MKNNTQHVALTCPDRTDPVPHRSPDVSALPLERQFEAFGCKHVNVEIERLGLRRTVNYNGGRDPGHFSEE